MITNMAMDIYPKTDTIEAGKEAQNKEVSLDPSEWQLPDETIVALSEPLKFGRWEFFNFAIDQGI